MEYIVVNGGQYRWIADREELVEALVSLGWEQDIPIWTEPENEDDPSAEYTRLCERVPDRSEEANKEDDSLPSFTYEPHLGLRSWRMS